MCDSSKVNNNNNINGLSLAINPLGQTRGRVDDLTSECLLYLRNARSGLLYMHLWIHICSCMNVLQNSYKWILCICKDNCFFNSNFIKIYSLVQPCCRSEFVFVGFIQTFSVHWAQGCLCVCVFGWLVSWFICVVFFFYFILLLLLFCLFVLVA